MASEQKTICVDFDQTICKSEYPGVGPLIPGAKQALQLFKALGYRIIISSCRACAWNWDIYYENTPFKHAKDRPVFQDMVKFLDDNEIPYDEIDDGTKGKVSAAYMIDDKGVRFQNNWDEIAFLIHQEDIKAKVQAAAQQQAALNQQGSAQMDEQSIANPKVYEEQWARTKAGQAYRAQQAATQGRVPR